MSVRTALDTRPGRYLDRSEPPAPRQEAAYRCERGHEFAVILAAQVAPPEAWECRCGAPAHHPATVSRTPSTGNCVLDDLDEHGRRMEQLLQRRSVAELEEILADRLAELAAVRKSMQKGPAQDDSAAHNH